jgi:hypothetical protein
MHLWVLLANWLKESRRTDDGSERSKVDHQHSGLDEIFLGTRWVANGIGSRSLAGPVTKKIPTSELSMHRLRISLTQTV